MRSETRILRRLRHKDRGHRKIKRASVEVKTIPCRHYETDDSRRHAIAMLGEALRRHDIDSDNLYSVANFLARTRSRLLALSLEDLLKVADQPNIPGTVDEHPNWRRRLPVAIDQIKAAIDVAALRHATGERLAQGVA